MSKQNSFFNLGRRALLSLSLKQRRSLLKSTLAGSVNAGLEWISLAAVIPVLYQLLNGEAAQPYAQVLQSVSRPALIISIVVIFSIKSFLSYWLARKQLDVTNRIYIQLSEKMYTNYFQQGYTSYTRSNPSDAFRRIKNTAFDFSNQVLHAFLIFISDAMICAVTTLLMIWIDYRIALATFILGIPTLIFYYFFKKHLIKKIDESFRKLTPEANHVLSQGIESYVEARIYHAEQYFINTFLNISRQTSDLLGRLKVLSTMPSRIMELVGISSIVTVIFFGSAFTSETEILFMLGLFSLAIYRIMPSFNRMIGSVAQIQSYSYSVDEIAVLQNGEENDKMDKNERFPFNNSIILHNLSFSYNRSHQHVFQNLNTKIEKGDFVLLTGISGSGKTTLIHMLAGLVEPTSGQIRIDNQELTNNNLAAWQNCLGYVPQAAVIHNDTIINNILFVKENILDQDRLQHAINVSGLREVIDELPDGFETLVGEQGLTLSGGQRQRLVLARALYRNPDVLLLDEVTNQLDEKSKMDILGRLKSLTKNGKTIILSSHDAAARSFASKEIRLGRLEHSNVISVVQ